MALGAIITTLLTEVFGETGKKLIDSMKDPETGIREFTKLAVHNTIFKEKITMGAGDLGFGNAVDEDYKNIKKIAKGLAPIAPDQLATLDDVEKQLVATFDDPFFGGADENGQSLMIGSKMGKNIFGAYQNVCRKNLKFHPMMIEYINVLKQFGYPNDPHGAFATMWKENIAKFAEVLGKPNDIVIEPATNLPMMNKDHFWLFIDFLRQVNEKNVQAQGGELPQMNERDGVLINTNIDMLFYCYAVRDNSKYYLQVDNMWAMTQQIDLFIIEYMAKLEELKAKGLTGKDLLQRSFVEMNMVEGRNNGFVFQKKRKRRNMTKK